MPKLSMEMITYMFSKDFLISKTRIFRPGPSVRQTTEPIERFHMACYDPIKTNKMCITLCLRNHGQSTGTPYVLFSALCHWDSWQCLRTYWGEIITKCWGCNWTFAPDLRCAKGHKVYFFPVLIQIISVELEYILVYFPQSSANASMFTQQIYQLGLLLLRKLVSKSDFGQQRFIMEITRKKVPSRSIGNDS